MKLPSKIEVNNAVAIQRKKDIDEGLTIARKVDTLRQTLSSLQQQHEQFIAGMEGELKRRTDYLISQIANLEKDIMELEERKRLLQIPLDEEWTKVNQTKLEIDNLKSSLEKQKEKLDKRELIQDERDRKSREILVRVKARDRASIKAYEIAENTKNEIEKIKSEISIEKENKKSEYEKKDKEYDIKEQSLVSYEFTLKMREEQIEIKEKEVEEEKIRLLDQRGTLERALARINKK